MNKIKKSELDLIIAEIERLSQQKEQEINRQELIEILQELSLPIDQLDEALLIIKKKQTANRNKKKISFIFVLFFIGFIGYIAYENISWKNHQKALHNMIAIDGRITLEEDNKNNLEIINRQDSPRLHFRVTFKNTPVGKPLLLGCDWINSQGQIIHQNRYQTRPVEKDIWHTRCRYRIGKTSIPGTWQVKMFSGDRLLRSQTFQVK